MANEIDRKPSAQGRRSDIPRTAGEVTMKELGLDDRRVAEWRDVRDAGEEVVEETIQTALKEGRTPTKTEILDAAKERKGKPRKRYVGQPFEEESQHDRDLRMLKGVWDGACESAQQAFLAIVASPIKSVAHASLSDGAARSVSPTSERAANPKRTRVLKLGPWKIPQGKPDKPT